MKPDPSSSASDTAVKDRLRELEAQVLHLQTTLNQVWPLFQSSPVAALLLSPQGRILDINARGAALLRSNRQILLGRTFTSSLTVSSESTLATVLARVFEGRGPQKGEFQLPATDGQFLELALEAVLVESTNQPPQCHLTLTDVTAFKLAHRALWDTQQTQALRLEDHASKLRELQQEFEQVMLSAGRELDSTLTRAASFLTLVRHHPETPSYLEHVAEGIQQTQGVLASLKRYMQLRFMRARTRSVNLNQVLREALKDIQNQQIGRDIQITSVLLPTVQGDSQVLQLILTEYLSNALKFTRGQPQARLHLLLQEDDIEYRIGVQDNGVGFNMRQKEKAFALFGRLHPSRLYEGTGLGLATVRRLCERFGGRAWGESKIDQGATFWFAWPKMPVES